MGNEFWDDLGRKVTGAADVLEKKTGEVVELTRLKSRQYAAERELKDKHEEVGRLVCAQYQEGQTPEGNEDIVEACRNALAKQEELENILEQVERCGK